MNRGVLRTTLMWHDSTGGEVEAEVRVTYSATKGYPQTWDEPGAPDEVEIISITPVDPDVTVPACFHEEAELLAECHADWIEAAEEAREWLAQSHRDDLLMEKF